jgi:hypothetical protein
MTVPTLTIQLAMLGIEEEIIKIAVGVSTPIALAGLAAAILFLLFRMILSTNFIPQLTKAGGLKVIKWIITTVFIFALVTACFGFAGYVIRTKYPTLSADYVDVGTGEPQTLEAVVNAVKVGRNVTVEFMNCSPAVKSAVVEPGNHDGIDIKDLLEKLRQRVRGQQPEYRVEKKGDRRYEIICP